MDNHYVLNDEGVITVLSRSKEGGVDTAPVKAFSDVTIPRHVKSAIVAELNVTYAASRVHSLACAKDKVDEMLKDARTLR